jgi:hypothetical protein
MKGGDNTGSGRIPFPILLTGPAHSPVLDGPNFGAAAPILPGVPRLRLPPALPHRYDGEVTKISHGPGAPARVRARHTWVTVGAFVRQLGCSYLPSSPIFLVGIDL